MQTISLRTVEDTVADVDPAPSDVTIGELYRLTQALGRRLDEISTRLENKVVTIDVYSLSHQALSDRVSELEKEDVRRQDQRRTVYVAVGASLIASFGAVAASLIATIK